MTLKNHQSNLTAGDTRSDHGVQGNSLSGQFCIFCEFKYFCIVVAISDLVHNVETRFHLFKLSTAAGNFFLLTNNAEKLQFCSFPVITHISENISRCF